MITRVGRLARQRLVPHDRRGITERQQRKCQPQSRRPLAIPQLKTPQPASTRYIAKSIGVDKETPLQARIDDEALVADQIHQKLAKALGLEFGATKETLLTHRMMTHRK